MDGFTEGLIKAHLESVVRDHAERIGKIVDTRPLRVDIRVVTGSHPDYHTITEGLVMADDDGNLGLPPASAKE